MARFFLFFFFALLAVAHALPLVERRSSPDVVENIYGRDLNDRGDLALNARQYEEELASITDRDVDNNLERRFGILSISEGLMDAFKICKDVHKAHVAKEHLQNNNNHHHRR